jgi:ABC-type amino acid transport substrate-binding protein
MRSVVALLVGPWLLAAGFACAQFDATEDAAEAFSGTLLKARRSGTVTIAHRESSVPFSYLNTRGEPIGYSIELCRALVDAMTQAVGRELEIRWLPVTSENRIDAITSGRADLECGSTTSNLERSKRVAFSPTFFVSGTKLMVKRGSPIKSFRDLRGKTVVVTARDHADSFAQVADGRADAFASDDVLLYGLIARGGARGRYDVVGEFLSYDPYGIMYRRGDPQMQRLVNETFRELAEDGEVERQYKRWFLKRLPSGEAIDLPMSAQLESLVRAMAAKPE